ncbi:MAG: hypothetical protein AAFQ05_04620, partial [Pseudomonadota bacterium]
IWFTKNRKLAEKPVSKSLFAQYLPEIAYIQPLNRNRDGRSLCKLTVSTSPKQRADGKKRGRERAEGLQKTISQISLERVAKLDGAQKA